jgi:hypothetical protein
MASPCRETEMIETYEVKNASGEVMEEVDYDTETMLIEEIRLWSETAQAFRPTSVWQMKAMFPTDYDELEKKIETHEAQRLLDVADAANEFRYFNLTGDR